MTASLKMKLKDETGEKKYYIPVEIKCSAFEYRGPLEETGVARLTWKRDFLTTLILASLNKMCCTYSYWPDVSEVPLLWLLSIYRQWRGYLQPPELIIFKSQARCLNIRLNGINGRAMPGVPYPRICSSYQ